MKKVFKKKLMFVNNITLKYDYNGLRIQKGNRTYYWQGNNLIMECWLNGSIENYIYYYYDESGVCGICYNDSEYYYRYNIFSKEWFIKQGFIQEFTAGLKYGINKIRDLFF